MIQLEVFGESAAMAAVAESLDGSTGVSRVMCVERDPCQGTPSCWPPCARGPSIRSWRSSAGSECPTSEITLSRVEVVGRSAAGAAETTLVWADVLGAAWHNARPIAPLPGVDVRCRRDRRLRRDRATT